VGGRVLGVDLQLQVSAHKGGAHTREKRKSDSYERGEEKTTTTGHTVPFKFLPF